MKKIVCLTVLALSVNLGCGKQNRPGPSDAHRGHDHGHGDAEGTSGTASDPHVEALKNSKNPRADFIHGPTDVGGYLNISWWFMNKDLDEAFDIIEEGIGYNPDAFQLHHQLGQLYLKKARNATPEGLDKVGEEAKAHLVTAGKLYQKAMGLGVKEKREHPGPEWSEIKDQDLRAPARMAVLMEQRVGADERARAMAIQYIEVLNGDEVLARLARNMSESN